MRFEPCHRLKTVPYGKVVDSGVLVSHSQRRDSELLELGNQSSIVLASEARYEVVGRLSPFEAASLDRIRVCRSRCRALEKAHFKDCMLSARLMVALRKPGRVSCHRERALGEPSSNSDPSYSMTLRVDLNYQSAGPAASFVITRPQFLRSARSTCFTTSDRVCCRQPGREL